VDPSYPVLGKDHEIQKDRLKGKNLRCQRKHGDGIERSEGEKLMARVFILIQDSKESDEATINIKFRPPIPKGSVTLTAAQILGVEIADAIRGANTDAG
jgi:hypothetical protein